MTGRVGDVLAVVKAALTGGDPVAVLLDRFAYREREDR